MALYEDRSAMFQQDDDIVHFGVKGMKWGVRRFQKKSGELTPAGKRRYAEAEARRASAERVLTKANARYERDMFDPRATEEQRVAEIKYKHAREDVANAKLLNMLDVRGLSKHEQKYADAYRKSGMTEDEARIAAYKRSRTEKTLAVVGTITIGALAAYSIKRHYERNAERVIPKGTLIQNISRDGNKGVSDAFYGSYHSRDNFKYTGMYGNQLRTNRDPLGRPLGNRLDVFATKIEATDDIRVASPESAKNVFANLMRSDPDFREQVNERNRINYVPGGRLFSKQLGVTNRGYRATRAGKYNMDAYEAFNMGLCDHLPENQRTITKFYDAMRKAGYDAVQDVNDKRYSGYDSKDPVIFFGGGQKLSVKERKKVDDADITIKNAVGSAEVLAKAAAKAGALVSGISAGADAVKRMSSASAANAVVKQYRKEHPNTKMSNTEIRRKYELGEL